MGTDWAPYFDSFKEASFYGSLTDLAEGYEFLYNLFIRIVVTLTNNYTVFLVLHAIIIYILYFKWLNKYVPHSFFISLLIFYSSMIGMLGMNRQHIALALCLFSSSFFLDKKYFKFALLNLIAIGFHTSAVLFPLMIYIANKRYLIKHIILVLILALFINQTGMGTSFFAWFTSKVGGFAESKSAVYLDYEAKRTIASFLLGLGKRCVIFLPIYLLRNRIDWDNKYFRIALNMYFISILMTILFNGDLQFLVGRLTCYYAIFECILFGFVAKYIKSSLMKNFYILFVLIYSIITFYRSIDLYPELFIPYKSVLF